VVITFVQTGALYLSAAWLSVIGAGLLADAIVVSERLRQRSLDSQLVRLGVRLAGIAIAIGLLVQGSYELGFPAYSVLAGLGVGGLAVALAARDSLANLLGSMLIMIEKLFRVGHVVRVAGSEGTVENVGFRSTRVRTSDNSLVSIPNNSVVNATVENLSLRMMRRQRLLIQVTYDTSREKLEELIASIKQAVVDHPMTNKTNSNVRFNDFGESRLNILVYFYLETTNYSAELEAREEILLRIMDLAKQSNIDFAFLTRTLVIENASGMDVDIPEGAICQQRRFELRSDGFRLSRSHPERINFLGPLWVDTVEKLRKRIAVKFRPNDILSENRCSMPPQCGYGGRLLLQRQLPRPPQIFFRFSSPRLYKLWLIAENRVFRQHRPKAEIQTKTLPKFPFASNLRYKRFCYTP
jgi:small-conductance mechanosensitive channel